MSEVKGPVVEGKIKGSTDKHYIPFSDDGKDKPIIATEGYVDSKIPSSSPALTVYTTKAGEAYDDSRLPDVLVVDGSMQNDITATLTLKSAGYRRFWFVNQSTKYEIHVSGAGGSFKVAGPSSTALILANKDGWQVISVSPYVAPTKI